MTTVSDHYAKHLAPIYAWMVGGLESAFTRGAAELTALGLEEAHDVSAVDLGAGFTRRSPDSDLLM